MQISSSVPSVRATAPHNVCLCPDLESREPLAGHDSGSRGMLSLMKEPSASLSAGLTTENRCRRIDRYASLITEERLQRMHTVLDQRTRYITIVLENIFQPHNASAVLRSCDAFGIQDVHIIENSNSFRPNPAVSLGTGQWLSLHRYREREDNTRKAIRALKAQGYRIVATTPHTDDVDLEDLDLSAGKVACLFGTEMQGLSPEALEEADEYMKIPMQGFVESLNISVCCAITAYQLTARLRSSSIAWHLGEDERQELLYHWLRNNVRNPELHDAEVDAR